MSFALFGIYQGAWRDIDTVLHCTRRTYCIDHTTLTALHSGLQVTWGLRISCRGQLQSTMRFFMAVELYIYSTTAKFLTCVGTYSALLLYWKILDHASIKPLCKSRFAHYMVQHLTVNTGTKLRSPNRILPRMTASIVIFSPKGTSAKYVPEVWTAVSL